MLFVLVSPASQHPNTSRPVSNEQFTSRRTCKIADKPSIRRRRRRPCLNLLFKSSSFRYVANSQRNLIRKGWEGGDKPTGQVKSASQPVGEWIKAEMLIITVQDHQDVLPDYSVRWYVFRLSRHLPYDRINKFIIRPLNLVIDLLLVAVIVPSLFLLLHETGNC